MILRYNQLITESSGDKIWYHGTPDARNVQKNGFTENKKSTTYLKDIDAYHKVQKDMQQARKDDDMDLYHELLDKVPDTKEDFLFNKPIFLTDNYRVASTYADPQRAWDYQESIPKIFKIGIKDEGKVLKIEAHGRRFRFIDVDYVKQGLIRSGVSEKEAVETIDKFNFVSSKDGITTDKISAIAFYLGFDIVDVIGVLDSYHGGTIRSTVRMVFDPKNLQVYHQ